MPRRGYVSATRASTSYKLRFVARLALLECADDRGQVARARAKRNRLADAFVEHRAAHGILLPQQQVGQRRGSRDRVIALGQRAAAVFHAGRRIDQQAAAQVGVFFELLDVQPILLGPHFPIDAAQVVAGGVFAVLQELDALAEVRTAVHAAEQPFDDVSCANLEATDPLDHLRMQRSFGSGRHGSVGLRAWA